MDNKIDGDLLDYFAAQALIGLLSRDVGKVSTCYDHAKFAYRQAEEMIRVRRTVIELAEDRRKALGED